MDTADRTGRPPQRRARPLTLIAVLLLALAVIAVVVLTGHGRHDHGDRSGGSGVPGAPGASRAAGEAASFHAGDADTVVLDGVSGRVRVTADGRTDHVSGSYARGDGARAHISVRTDPAAGPRTLTVVCGDPDGRTAAPCAGDLALIVPAHTGLRLRQSSGETVLTGLGGDVAATVASDRFTAQGLHPGRADLTVTSGSADLGFTAPPRSVALNATSASVALRLPGADAYAVTSAATSADVRVQVPRDPAATHKVALRVLSGSLAVLPS